MGSHGSRREGCTSPRAPHHLDQIRAQVYLLFRLAQRGLQQRVVGRVHAASGERDLACVVREMILSHRVDEMRPLRRAEPQERPLAASPRRVGVCAAAAPPSPRPRARSSRRPRARSRAAARPLLSSAPPGLRGGDPPGFQSVSVGLHPLIISHGAGAARIVSAISKREHPGSGDGCQSFLAVCSFDLVSVIIRSRSTPPASRAASASARPVRTASRAPS